VKENKKEEKNSRFLFYFIFSVTSQKYGMMNYYYYYYYYSHISIKSSYGLIASFFKHFPTNNGQFESIKNS